MGAAFAASGSPITRPRVGGRAVPSWANAGDASSSPRGLDGPMHGARTPRLDMILGHPGDSDCRQPPGCSNSTACPRRSPGAPHFHLPTATVPDLHAWRHIASRARRQTQASAHVRTALTRHRASIDTAHGGAPRSAAVNGPSAQSFDQRGLHRMRQLRSFVRDTIHRPGNQNLTLYE